MYSTFIVQGTTGLTGNGGWYLHFTKGVTPELHLVLKLLPPGQHILFATRYPPGTTLNIERTFRWYPSSSKKLVRAESQREVLLGNGLQFFFDGHHLLMKLIDPGAEVTMEWPFFFHDTHSDRARMRVFERLQLNLG
jgi:hypothetical protein